MGVWDNERKRWSGISLFFIVGGGGWLVIRAACPAPRSSEQSPGDEVAKDFRRVSLCVYTDSKSSSYLHTIFDLGQVVQDRQSNC